MSKPYLNRTTYSDYLVCVSLIFFIVSRVIVSFYSLITIAITKQFYQMYPILFYPYIIYIYICEYVCVCVCECGLCEHTVYFLAYVEVSMRTYREY